MDDVIDPNASKEVAMSSLDWCTRSRQLNLLNAVLRAHFSNCAISDLERECSHVLRNAVTAGCKDTLTSLLRHVDETFLRQRHEGEGNDDVRDERTRLDKLLGLAVEHGHRDVAEVLLEKGANTNVSYHNKPLLHLSISLGYAKVASLLVDHGADVNMTDSKGETPLFGAVSSEAEEMNDVIDKLVTRGADMSHVSLTGRQPIHSATLSLNPQALARLALAGCDVSARDDIMGNTPLHLACARCNPEAVVTLIRHGAHFNCLNNHGDTPLRKLLQHTTRVLKDFHYHTRMKLAQILVALGFRLLPPSFGKSCLENVPEFRVVPPCGAKSSSENPPKNSSSSQASSFKTNFPSSKKEAQKTTSTIPERFSSSLQNLNSVPSGSSSNLNSEKSDSVPSTITSELDSNANSKKLSRSSRKDRSNVSSWDTSSVRCRGRDKVGEVFQSLMSERKRVPDLQHLCRLEVRRHLPSAGFQERVKELEVSPYLHQYLMFRPILLDGSL